MISIPSKCPVPTILIALFLFLFSQTSSLAQAPDKGVSRADCFPVERLSESRRARAEELLLKALDSEALYTIAGGIKPMSSGFFSSHFPERMPRSSSQDEKMRARIAEQQEKRRTALTQLEETREALSAFRCDLLYADLQHFAKTAEGERYTEAVVFNLPLLRDTLTRYSGLFERWGLTASSHPMEVLMAVEYDETSARNGGYGFLYGYPDYAVKFFVEAADHEAWTGEFVVRDFYSVPIFSRPTNGFVWAVPKGYQETEADRDLKARSVKILDEYRARRAKYIGPGKQGVVALLRDWFTDGKGQYSPRYAYSPSPATVRSANSATRHATPDMGRSMSSTPTRVATSPAGLAPVLSSNGGQTGLCE